MAVILYHEGDETEVNGIRCNIGRFDPFQYQERIDAGWVVDPSELYQEEEPTEEGPTEEGPTEQSNDEIRQAAKLAGIEGWENGRISRLKRELGYGG